MIKQIWSRYWNYYLAALLIIIQFGNFIMGQIAGSDLQVILWYCHVASIILALSLLFKNAYWTNVILITSIPAQLPWIVDFILQFFGLGFGRTGWIFDLEGALKIAAYFSVFMHSILIPIAAYATYKLGFRKGAIWGALFLIMVLSLASFLFTEPAANINCVFYSCDLLLPKDKELIYNNSLYFTKQYFVNKLLLITLFSLATYLVIYKVTDFKTLK